MAAYIVVVRERIQDASALDTYYEKAVRAPREKLTPRARYGRIEVAEGPTCEGIALLEFPTFEDAQAWYWSDAYQEAREFRRKAGDYRVAIVDGLPTDKG